MSDLFFLRIEQFWADLRLTSLDAWISARGATIYTASLSNFGAARRWHFNRT
jgi:hypothetical protein